MYTPRGDTVQSRSLSTPPPATLSAVPLTPQQAEESIEYIQRELARLLRACEYREQHPYDAATAAAKAEDSGAAAPASSTLRGVGTSDSAAAMPEAVAASFPKTALLQRRDSAPSLTASGQPPFKLAQSTLIASASCTQLSPRTEAPGAAAATAGPSTGGGSGAATTMTTVTGSGTTAAPSAAAASANLGGASFSSFERRRIAHLLGRVALEIAGVWAYVQHVDPSQGGTPMSSLPTTARGTVRQSSDRSTAAPVASSGPPTPSSAPDEAVVADTGAAPPQHAQLLRPPVLRRGVWGETAQERCEAYEGDPAAQIAALGALIETAAAIRLALAAPQSELPKAAAAAATAAPPPSPPTESGVARRGSAASEMPDGGVGGKSPGVESSSLSNTLSTTMEAAPAGSLTFSSPSFGVSRASLREALGDHLRGAVAGAAAAFETPPSSSPLTAHDVVEEANWEGRRGRVDRTQSSTARADTSPAPVAAHGVAMPGHEPRSRSPLFRHARFAVTPAALPSAIPAYLRAYVVEDGAESSGSAGVQRTSTSEGTATRSTSGGSAAPYRADACTPTAVTTPAAPDPPHRRAFAAAVRAGGEPAALTRSHAATLHFTSTPPVMAAPLATAASAPISVAAPAVAAGGSFADVVPTSYNSSLPMQRATSASSLRSTSLMGSPVQAAQLSGARSAHGYSGGSASSHHNNASVSQRSPDSAEMSPAAAAAYSRSTSLLRRPHRLEVPVSRTHSLRRLPSLSSPVSVAGASRTSAASAAATAAATAGASAATHPPSTGASALAAALHGAHGSAPAPSYTPSKSAGSFRVGSGGSAGGAGAGGGGSSGGILRTSSYSASSPPVALGGSVTADSPHSSVAGMHFKRVVSLDSEGGGWPQGSLADSLEMSQLKPGSLPGRPSASTMRSALSSSPPPPHHHQELRTSGFRAASGGGVIAGVVASSDVYGALTSPLDLPSGTSMLNVPASGSFSFGQLRGMPGSAPIATGGGGGGHVRQDGSRSHSSHSRNSTPNPILTGSPIVAVSSPGIYGPAAFRSRSATAPATSASPSRDGLRGPVVVPPSAMPAPHSSPSAALGKSMSSGGLGFAAEEDLPPHSYRVEHEVLTEFLRCVHDLRRANLTEAEFDSLQLRYFLPGVSLSTTPGGHGWPPPPPPPSPSAPPLPLFEGGDTVPLRRDDLDTFCALVRERLMLVCHNLRIVASPYLALL